MLRRRPLKACRSELLSLSRPESNRNGSDRDRTSTLYPSRGERRKALCPDGLSANHLSDCPQQRGEDCSCALLRCNRSAHNWAQDLSSRAESKPEGFEPEISCY